MEKRLEALRLPGPVPVFQAEIKVVAQPLQPVTPLGLRSVAGADLLKEGFLERRRDGVHETGLEGWPENSLSPRFRMIVS